MDVKYEFTNWTDDTFIGRYGGVNYTFAPNETRTFDADKHYQLILMSKQLADRELSKRVKKVGRDPKDMETWGKALDAEGHPLVITDDMRKALMRNAIGSLLDTPIPVPDDKNIQPEAGSSKVTNENVASLQSEVKELKELVQALVKQQAPRPSEVPVSQSIKHDQTETPNQQPMGMTREVLTSMAMDLGITDTDRMTKEELIHVVSSRQQQV